jgi:hypothetical protein
VRFAKRVRPPFLPIPPRSHCNIDKPGFYSTNGKGKSQLRGPAITHLFVSNRTALRRRELRYAEMGETRDMVEYRRIEVVFNEEVDA